VRRGELPGSGTQHSLDKVSRSEEKQHNKHPRKFPGDHRDVVVGVVHELLATGDGLGVVTLRAADLVIPTNVQSTFSDGMHSRAKEKENGEHRQGSAFVEKHRGRIQRGEMIK